MNRDERGEQSVKQKNKMQRKVQSNVMCHILIAFKFVDWFIFYLGYATMSNIGIFDLKSMEVHPVISF